VPVTVVGPVDAARLPLVELEPLPRLDAWKERPAELPKASLDAPELSVRAGADSGAITLREPWLGKLRHRFYPGGETRPGIVGGVSGECGAAARVDPLRWEGVRMRADGALDVAAGLAWFDGGRCGAVTLWHLSAVARPVYGEEIYAFRSRCPRCDEGTRERLHVVYATLRAALREGRDPANIERDGSWELELESLDIAPGSASSVAIPLASLRRSDGERASLVVEAQRGIREEQPTLFVYLREPRRFIF
jgi:hypothetical protein